jgi:hypothetical protein
VGVPAEEIEKQFIATDRPTSLIGRSRASTKWRTWSSMSARPRLPPATGATLRVDGGVVHPIG